MVEHPFRTAATTTAGVYTGVLLEAGVKRTILVLGVAETLGDFTFTVGEIPLAVAWAKTGYVYYYDSTDATTPDDGLTTLVTGNGLRYAIEDSASISLNSVLGVVAAPTGAETIGDAYIVGVGTGAFAGQDDNQAFLTRRGWVFAVPEIGATVLNTATGQNTQFGDAGWGAFGVTFADGSIAPKALQFPGGIVVENTLNTPPGAPTVGKFWIVGSAPTGAFAGHAADLAYWTGSAWAFMDPADGWSAFHKTFGFEVFYTSGSWLGGAGSDYQDFSTAGSFTWTKPARGTKCKVQVWGAGGSGGRAGATDAGGGGGGGAYAEWEFALSEMSSSETVTVGAGGPARTSDEQDGIAGGNSSLGTKLVAYGGGGGTGATSSSGAGGGGGGIAGAGASTSSPSVGGNGGAGAIAGTGGGAQAGAGGSGVSGSDSVHGGGGGGAGASGSGGNSVYGGGGGGGNNATNGGAGGSSYYGGGGGGGGGTSASGLGGTSRFGGGGGNGSGGTAVNGAQPGGGGGGSSTGNSGKGGDGRVRVTVW